MINLLPYSRRALLKTLYKKRLIVVGLFGVAAILIPLVFVLIVISYLQYQNLNAIQTRFNLLNQQRQDEGIDDLSKEIQNVNFGISAFKESVSKIKPVSKITEDIISSRPSDVKIISFDFVNTTTASITGVSGSRDSIISYGNILGKDGKNFCIDVNVPVTTYTKKNDVPFSITCTINYETK